MVQLRFSKSARIRQGHCQPFALKTVVTAVACRRRFDTAEAPLFKPVVLVVRDDQSECGDEFEKRCKRDAKGGGGFAEAGGERLA
jgi:hypothetical protein